MVSCECPPAPAGAVLQPKQHVGSIVFGPSVIDTKGSEEFARAFNEEVRRCIKEMAESKERSLFKRLDSEYVPPTRWSRARTWLAWQVSDLAFWLDNDTAGH